jgi:hypothetical protein
MPANAYISLRELPALWFPTQWDLLLQASGSCADAIAALDRSQTIEGPHAEPAETIVAGVRELAVTGAIQVEGRYTGNDQLQTLPAERWQGAIIGFVEGVVANPVRVHDPFHSEYHHYHSLRIRLVERPSLPPFAETFEAWMRDRIVVTARDDRESLKQDMTAKFGAVPIRVFNEVYGKVVGRARGRPPKRNP